MIHDARLCAAALVENGHRINRVFLQGDAVFLAARPSDAQPVHTGNADCWERLINAWSLPATVCAGSAHERALDGTNLRTGWQIGGLGDWVLACNEADRLLQFTGER